jgi:O-antigen/teichoic acid export membrane protein
MTAVEATSSLTRPTARGVAVRGAGMALGFVLTVFLARRLTAEDLGAYQGVLSVAIILGGLAAATAERPAARRIAAMRGDDPSELPRELALVHLVVGVAVAVIVVGLLAGSMIPHVPGDARTVMRCAALVAPGLAMLSLRQWVALPLHGVAASLGPEQIGLPIAFVAVAGVASATGRLGPVEALAIHALVCWSVWILSSWRSGLLAALHTGVGDRRWSAGLRERVNGRLREARPFLVFSAVGVLPIYVTVPLVALLLDVGDAGRLAIALQLSMLVAVPLQIASLAVMPACARLHRDGQTADLADLVRSASTISLVSGLALAVLLLVVLDPILHLLGPTYAATEALVPVLVVGQLVNAALGPNGPTLQMIGSDRDAAWVEAAASVVRISTVALAAVSGSIVAVAAAVAATSMLRNLALTVMLHRRTGILTLPRIPDRRARPA